MQNLLLKNVNAILPDGKSENISILIEEGKISEIIAKETKVNEVLDLTNLTLFAGFIDIHIYGQSQLMSTMHT